MDLLTYLIGYAGIGTSGGLEGSDALAAGLAGIKDANYDMARYIGGYTWVVDQPGHYERRSRAARIPYVDHTAGAALQASLVVAGVVQAAAGAAPLLASLSKLLPG